jgi:hypothetical protein
VRSYDVFAAANGKNFLTAQQRHHCGVIEGTMKAAPVRYWWENPSRPLPGNDAQTLNQLSPVYSMAMHSDALWTLTGADARQLFSLQDQEKLMYMDRRDISISSYPGMSLESSCTLSLVIKM